MSSTWARHWPVALCVAFLAGATPVAAEEVSELWRSPFGNPRALSVDSSNGTCWAATGNSVMCLSAADAVLAQIDGFSSPRGIAVNSGDGSCWVADTYSDQVVHLGQDGAVLWRGGSFSRPTAVAVDPTDGSCWVADFGHGELVRLGLDGTELLRLTGYAWPDPETTVAAGGSLAVNRTDTSCWAADEGNGRVMHLSAAGGVLLASTVLISPRAVSVNADDGSCWAADAAHGRIAHLSSAGAVEWQSEEFVSPLDLAVNASDGSCVIADSGAEAVIKVLVSGEELWRWTAGPRAVAVSPSDGSCWVANRRALGSVTGSYEVVRLSSSGSVLARHAGFTRPVSVSADHAVRGCWAADYESGAMARITADHVLEVNRTEPSQYQPRSVSAQTVNGSCWIAEEGGGLVHLSRDGLELLRDRRLMPRRVSVNSNDGSCWAGVMGGGTAAADEVYHISKYGDTLWHGGNFARVSSVSVNLKDNTCWVADQDADQVYHYRPYGDRIWSGAIDSPVSLSADPMDGSLWVVSADEQQGTSSVTHLAEDGQVLWSSDAFSFAGAISVNPTDGSCWVADWGTREVIHLDKSGLELSRLPGFWRARVSVDPADGSCWVCDEDNGQIIHLGISGYDSPTFPDVLCYQWCYEEVDACFAAGIVGGYLDGRYHGENTVTRDQMAVYISRALAGGDANVDPALGPPTFPDVLDDHWAFKYVEYAAANNIVSGFIDGLYRPQLPVDRAQMAAYIARSVVDPTGDEGLSDYVPPISDTFPDVERNSWAFVYVEYCAGQGIVQGYPDGLYYPGHQVTRAQMAVYICRAFGLAL